MYRIKPFQENIEITHKPTCMYSMKNIHNDGIKASKNDQEKKPEVVIANSLACQDLLKQQHKVLERLNLLEKRIDELLGNKVEKKIDVVQVQKQSNGFKRVEKKVNVNEIVKDIVIQIDPQNVSYSIAVLFLQLSSKYKCFVRFHTHGSSIEETNSNSYCQQLKDLFSLLKLDLNDPRLSYDYGFTVIWKKHDASKAPVMYLDSTNSVPIYGESNILRFLSRLDSDECYEKVLNSTQVALADDLIDSCTNQLKNSNEQKLNSAFLQSLEDKLKNSQNLISSLVTIADIYVWSVLKQKSRNVNLTKFNQVNQWKNRVESSNNNNNNNNNNKLMRFNVMLNLWQL